MISQPSFHLLCSYFYFYLSVYEVNIDDDIDHDLFIFFVTGLFIVSLKPLTAESGNKKVSA